MPMAKCHKLLLDSLHPAMYATVKEKASRFMKGEIFMVNSKLESAACITSIAKEATDTLVVIKNQFKRNNVISKAEWQLFTDKINTAVKLCEMQNKEILYSAMFKQIESITKLVQSLDLSDANYDLVLNALDSYFKLLQDIINR